MDRQNEIEFRIAQTPTTTLLGIVTKLRLEAESETDYEFASTEPLIKTALAGAEHLLEQSQKGA